MQPLRSHHSNRRGSSSQRAFTFTELLVVVGVMVLLMLVLLPAQADSRVKSRSIRCLDNLRQIMNAVLLYTGDNHDFFPPNPDDGNTVLGHHWCQGNGGVGEFGPFNPDILTDPTRCLITTYLHTNVSLFRCTADPRFGTYQGSDPAKIGTTVPAARSISMNQAVGTICPTFNTGGGHSGVPTMSVNGPWLNNNDSHRRNTPWRTYGQLSDVIIPGPANLWVITEEDPFSINDASFAFGINIPEWVNWPSTLHDMSCVVTFADGHVELHKWVDPSTRVVNGKLMRRSVPGSADWAWLKARTSARAH